MNNAEYSIGIDLGGTNIAGGVVIAGELTEKISVPTEAHMGIPAVSANLVRVCRELIDRMGGREPLTIGIGAPGVIDTEKCAAERVVNIADEPLEFRKLLDKYSSIPIYAENDANCAAIGEAMAGASKGADNSVMVTLGTGVGGGIIINGKLFSGSYGGGGEIGHMTICCDDGVVCKCGRRGCFEQYASATALVRFMNELSPGAGRAENAHQVFEFAHNGDPSAKKAVERFIYYLSAGIANIINIFQPQVVVVGGGVSAQGEYILGPVRDEVKKNILTHDISLTKIVNAELGNDAGIIGAACCMKYR